MSCDWFTFDYFSYLVLTSFLVSFIYLLYIADCHCHNYYYYCINVGLFWNNCTEVRNQLLRIHDNNITDLKQKTLLLSYLVLLVLAKCRPSADFLSRVAFPNRETVNEIKTIFVFISTVDCTFSNEHLHEKMYAFGQPKQPMSVFWSKYIPL